MLNEISAEGERNTGSSAPSVDACTPAVSCQRRICETLRRWCPPFDHTHSHCLALSDMHYSCDRLTHTGACCRGDQRGTCFSRSQSGRRAVQFNRN